MRKVGFLLLAIGILGALAALTMNTTVETRLGNFHNIGLLNQQQNFTIFFAAIALVGTILTVFGGRNFNRLKRDDAQADQEAAEKVAEFEGDRNLSLPNYQLFLTRRFSISKDSILGKYTIGNEVFATLDDALAEAASRHAQQVQEAADRQHRESLASDVALAQRRQAAANRAAQSAQLKTRMDEGLVTMWAVIKRLLKFVIYAVVAWFIWLWASTTWFIYETWRDPAAAKTKNLSLRIRELEQMYASGNFFGYQIGEANLDALTKVVKTDPIKVSDKTYRVTCNFDQCGALLAQVASMPTTKAVAFTYCVKDRGQGASTGQPGQTLLTGVSIFFESAEKNVEIESVILKSGATTRRNPDGPYQELAITDLGVGLFWKQTTGDSNVCGSQSEVKPTQSEVKPTRSEAVPFN